MISVVQSTENLTLDNDEILPDVVTGKERRREYEEHVTADWTNCRKIESGGCDGAHEDGMTERRLTLDLPVRKR